MFKKDSHEINPVDINELIREVLALVHFDVRGQRVSVRTELADKVPQVFGNRIQLQQVVLNLIMNAIEAMSSITDRERTLRVKLEAHQADGVLIVVEELGHGHRSEEHGKYIQPSFHDKITRNGDGTVDLPDYHRSPSGSRLGIAWP